MPKEREDVEATLEQGTTPDASQQKRKWRSIDRIAGTTLAAEVLMSFIWAILWVHECRFEHQLQVYFASVLIILTGGYLTLIFCPIFKKDDDPRWFHARILSSGIVGGSYAFLLPAVMGLEEGSVTSGGAAALRQAILLATGGLIGLIALGETRRKNDNDREAAESLQKHQQDTLNQQKKQFEEQLEKQQKQFEANAFKERKAERRERYTKAIEQLGDEKSSVRMGGVYTLVGLVDEWLEEESINKYEDRLKEGQVIINNLCAYIRSPFTLASHYDELSEDSPTASYKDREQEFYTGKAILDSEADVRLGIIKEIHDRLQGPEENTPGTWSDFEYDFSGSTFFYPVDLINSYYKKSVNFCGSRYYKEVNFSGSTYEKDVIFSTSDRRSTYQDVADFHESTYQGRADFSDSTYEGEAIFRGSTYQDVADFAGSTYQDWVDFAGSTYTKSAIFSTSERHSTYKKVDFAGSTYHGRVDFAGSTYQYVTFSTSTISDRQSIYQDVVNFSGSTYEDNAIFIGSTYAKDVTFSTSDYQKVVNFSESIYYGRADFSGSTHQNETYFKESIFYRETYFGKDGEINSFSRFTDYAPQFYDGIHHKKTLFGSHNNNFTVDTNKGNPIILDSESLLPLDCDFLTPEQQDCLVREFQDMEKINNDLLEVKEPREKVELSKRLRSLNKNLHKQRKKFTKE
ncbi:MAG: hypothetical protein ACFNNC_03955 [Rothia dentocariosa]